MEYKIENVVIDRIYRSTKDKDERPYVSKKGNPFTKVDIYIDPRVVDNDEFKGKMTYFDYFDNTGSWDVGTPISGIVSQNGKYFNFEMNPTGKKAVELDIKEISARVSRLEEKVFGFTSPNIEVNKSLDFTKALLEKDAEQEEIEDDGLPF